MPNERVSLLQIDLLLAGKLPPREAAALRERLSASPETSRYFREQSEQHSRLTLRDIRAAVERNRKKGLRAFVSLPRFFLSPGFAARSSKARSALALAFAALLGVGLWLSYPVTAPRHGGFSSKSGSDPEILLRIRGRDYAQGELVQAGPGDTLEFSYRDVRSIWMQVWFREQGGELHPFSGKHEGGINLPPATAWKLAPQRLLLEGNWSRQEVWVVVSTRRFPARAAEAAILRGAPGEDLRVQLFQLSRRP